MSGHAKSTKYPKEVVNHPQEAFRVEEGMIRYDINIWLPEKLRLASKGTKEHYFQGAKMHIIRTLQESLVEKENEIQLEEDLEDFQNEQISGLS